MSAVAYNYYYTSIKINGGVKKGWQYNKVQKNWDDNLQVVV